MLAISDIINETQEDIDTEILSRKLVRHIRNSKKFTLTNAIAASGAHTDKMLQSSRKLNDNAAFDPYTTQENGTLVAPDYSLAGKITQRTKTIGKNKRIDYQFLLVLTDLKSGRVVWDTDETISKLVAINAETESSTDSNANANASDAKSSIDASLKVLERKCNNGDAESCWELADMYDEGEKIARDYAKAAEYATKACDLGHARACVRIGYMYENGQGVKQDYIKARELYQKSCDGGDYGGCSNLGVLYDDGQGVKQNYAKAREYYQKACDGGNARGCANLGILYHNGIGVKQNYAKAKEFYQKACDGEIANGCSNLSFLYKNGQGVRQDYTKAKEFAGKACDLGEQRGCDWYKDLKNRGY